MKLYHSYLLISRLQFSIARHSIWRLDRRGNLHTVGVVEVLRLVAGIILKDALADAEGSVGNVLKASFALETTSQEDS